MAGLAPVRSALLLWLMGEGSSEFLFCFGLGSQRDERQRCPYIQLRTLDFGTSQTHQSGDWPLPMKMNLIMSSSFLCLALDPSIHVFSDTSYWSRLVDRYGNVVSLVSCFSSFMQWFISVCWLISRRREWNCVFPNPQIYTQQAKNGKTIPIKERYPPRIFQNGSTFVSSDVKFLSQSLCDMCEGVRP